MDILVYPTFLCLSYVSGCTALSPPLSPEVLEHYRPRVLMGAELFEKSLVCEIPEATVASDIQYGDLDPNPGMEFGVVGSRGAYLYKPDGIQLWHSSFKDKPWRNIRNGWFRDPPRPTLETFRIVDLNNDGSCEFVTFRDDLGNLVIAVDHQGNQLWTYPVPRSVGGLRCDWGDLTGDRNLEVVAYSSPKLVALDRTGNVLWETNLPESFPTAEADEEDASHPYGLFVADLDDDGGPEITLFLGGFFGCVCVRVFDATGRQILSREMPLALQFDFTRVPGSVSGKGLTLFAAEDEEYKTGIKPQHCLFTFPDFQVIRRYDTPVWFDPLVARVRLESDRPPYLAFGLHVLGARISRGLLYIYDNTGKQVYKEFVEGEFTALTTAPGAVEGSEVLLAVTRAADTEKFWSYSAVQP
jgi:hypothetical protein